MSDRPQDVTIRPAVIADLPEIIVLWKALQETNAIHEPRLKLNAGAAEWFETYLRTQLDNENIHIVVATRDELVIGYIFGQIMQRLTIDPKECGYVADLCVRSDARGVGIGRRLFFELRAWFISCGVKEIEVQVVRANPASQAFWRKMGFGEFLRTLKADI
jgi:ribosomal protein S18 acetylase RimI-like enzyme